ncbi:MAG: hypothetical protein GY918_07595, partial [Gammaproteobacteria bacterium]|nr:hypothetical protein [Gammaproteobacteria bacterium]
MVQPVTDTALLEQLNSISSGVGGAPQPKQGQVEGESPDFFDGAGSAIDHASARLGASARAALSTMTSDEDLSRYHRRKAQANIDEAVKLEEGMGTGAHILSSGVQMLPSLASFAVPGGMPLKMAAAGVTGAGQTYGDTLVRQQELGQEYDAGAAGSAAVSAGVTDAALGFLPIRGAGVGRQVKEAARDAASGAQQQVHSNLAVGADWDQDVGVAAAGGAVIGRSFEGLSKALNYGINGGGKKAASSATELADQFKIDADDSFLRGYVDYSNAKQGLIDELSAATDSKERERLATEITNLDYMSTGEAEMLDGMQFLKERGVPITPAMFRAKVEDLGRKNAYNLFEKLGYTEAEIQQAEIDIENATIAGVRNTAAQSAGETRASLYNMTQTAGKKALGDAISTFTNNAGKVNDLILSGGLGGDKALVDKLHLLKADLKELDSHMQRYYGNKEVNVSEDIRRIGKRALQSAADLGVLKDLSGISGKPGSFDPVADIHRIANMERLLKSQFKEFHMGAPDPAKEKSRKAITMSDLLIGGFSLPALAVKKGVEVAYNNIAGVRGQRKVRDMKEDAGERVDALLGKI